MSRIRELYQKQEEIDRRIAELFEQRMAVSEDISREKIVRGGRMIDKKMDHAEIEKISELMHSEFNLQGAQEVFTQMQALGRIRQYQLLEEEGVTGRLPFIAVDELDKEGVRVVYQGVEGAYSHAAMIAFFGEDVNGYHVDKWRDAMEAIADGAADYAVLPIENSSAGIVSDNFDLLVDFENYIVADQVVPCRHVLMGIPGTKLEQIERVYSHQQALAQCEEYLAEHDEWQQVSFPNTAMAARKVADDGLPTQAAIGSEFAAKHFGLEILAEKIFYNAVNSTRFIIVTNQRIFRKNANRISICFETPHHSGSLYSILSHVIYNHLNMNKIESRPIIGRNWEYRFFVDFEGNLAESNVKNALRGIRSDAVSMKILGNY